MIMLGNKSDNPVSNTAPSPDTATSTPPANPAPKDEESAPDGNVSDEEIKIEDIPF